MTQSTKQATMVPLSEEDRVFWNQQLARFSYWKDGLAHLDGDFSLGKRDRKGGYLLELISRNPARVRYEIEMDSKDTDVSRADTDSPEPRISRSDPILPDAPEPSPEQRKVADSILKQHGELWIIDRKDRVERVEVSGGGDAIARATRFITRYARDPESVCGTQLDARWVEGRVVLYLRIISCAFDHKHLSAEPVFSLTIDMQRGTVGDAAIWRYGPSVDSLRLLAAEEVAFLEQAFVKQGALGDLGNVTAGFRWHVDHSAVRISAVAEGWHVEVTVSESAERILMFTVDHGSGRVKDPRVLDMGEFYPTPHVSPRGPVDMN